MQEIYLLREGESIDALSIGQHPKTIKSDRKIFGYRYMVIQSGNDDVYFVRNYYPLYEYTIKDNETILDIMARGYNANDNGEKAGDTIILSKPTANRYVVQPMDTIQSIASKYCVDVKYIVDINHLKSTKLFIGQILWI